MEALEPWEERPNIETLPGLYMASEAQIRDILRELPETVRSVLVIGHNPGLHELAMTLIGAHAMTLGTRDMRRLAESYPSGALAEFLVPGPWHTLDEGGARLVRFICPRDLETV
jgi:phosphohistidine phosphatase